MLSLQHLVSMEDLSTEQVMVLLERGLLLKND